MNSNLIQQEFAATPEDILLDLKSRYMAFQDHLPLKRGVFKDILENHPEIKEDVLAKAMPLHVHCVDYLSNLKNGGVSF